MLKSNAKKMSRTSPIVNFLGNVLIITNFILYIHSNLNQSKIPLYFQVSLINNFFCDCNYEKSEHFLFYLAMY